MENKNKNGKINDADATGVQPLSNQEQIKILLATGLTKEDIDILYAIGVF